VQSDSPPPVNEARQIKSKLLHLISPGSDHDCVYAETLLDGLDRGTIVIADKGYDSDRVRSCIRHQGAIPNIPNRSN
jgi:IS5 family transposase